MVWAHQYGLWSVHLSLITSEKNGYGAKFKSSISKDLLHVSGCSFVNDVSCVVIVETKSQSIDTVAESVQGCLDCWNLALAQAEVYC